MSSLERFWHVTLSRSKQRWYHVITRPMYFQDVFYLSQEVIYGKESSTEV